MLYMVIERFKAPGALEVYRRARDQGRLLPDGPADVAGWVDLDFTTCCQLMETEDERLFEAWVGRWRDLVEFEIVLDRRSSAAAMAVIGPRL